MAFDLVAHMLNCNSGFLPRGGEALSATLGGAPSPIKGRRRSMRGDFSVAAPVINVSK